MLPDKHVAFVLQKLDNAMLFYQDLVFCKVAGLSAVGLETEEYLRKPPEGGYHKVETGDTWGGEWVNMWFRAEYKVPKELEGKKLFLQAHTGAVEAMLYVDGKPVGLFNESAGDAYYSLGQHHSLMICMDAAEGRTLDIALEAYAGHYCAGSNIHSFRTREGTSYTRVYQGMDVCTRDEDVLGFIIDLRTLLQLARALPSDSFRRADIENTLVKVNMTLEHVPQECGRQAAVESARRARQIMSAELAKHNGPSAPYAALIGHSHMDTAWLWPVEETVRKCARTYSLALSMMEQYPEYKFIQSSALHAKWMKDYYPQIFEGIKKRTAEGRWEPNGGVWVECDCNITGGEAMIRQFLRGQRFTRDELGYMSDTFWLPDTFGYSAAIPQILKGVGIRYFCTTKLSWNDTTRFPVDTFLWRGIDGTGVMAHFNTTHSWPDPKHLITALQGIKEGDNTVMHKRVNNSRLVAYGFGDGGGGPMFEMIEQARRVSDLEGCPKSEHSTVSAYLHKLEDETDLPTLDGELYLELHRGTLTQRHDVKRNNRMAEIALRGLEMAQVWARLAGKAAAASDIQGLWDTLLINQFHDILPGTCIREVYERTIPEVGKLISDADLMRDGLLARGGEGMTLVNTLSWRRSDVQYLNAEGYAEGMTCQRVQRPDGNEYLAVEGEIDAFSTLAVSFTDEKCTAPSPFRYDGKTLITPYAEVRFNEYGAIESFVDTTCGRQLVKETPLNTFFVADDIPVYWDCWDIGMDTMDQFVPQERLISREVVSEGPLQIRIRSKYAIAHKSTLTQDMVFHASTARVDFETVVDWRDPHHLLKAGFDLDILTPRMRSEIQFGYLERPTTRNNDAERAMFEVCNHKWSDISEARYGVALLNDCKYGISCVGGNMMLTLHKGGTHPDEAGDCGVHTLCYSLLPHSGSFTAENVVRPAYELNIKAVAEKGAIELPKLIDIESPSVIAEAVKLAEDDANAVVYRLYEAERGTARTKVTFPGKPVRAEATDMLEETRESLALTAASAELTFRPFEIKTIKVYY